jgi:hypothetical protein
MHTTKTSDLHFLIHHPESTRKNWLPSTSVIITPLQLILVIHKIYHILLYILTYFVFVWSFTSVFEAKYMLQRKELEKILLNVDQKARNDLLHNLPPSPSHSIAPRHSTQHIVFIYLQDFFFHQNETLS